MVNVQVETVLPIFVVGIAVVVFATVVFEILLAAQPLLEIGSLLFWSLCYCTCVLVCNRYEETLVKHGVNLSIGRNIHQVVFTTVAVEVAVHID